MLGAVHEVQLLVQAVMLGQISARKMEALGGSLCRTNGAIVLVEQLDGPLLAGL